MMIVRPSDEWSYLTWNGHSRRWYYFDVDSWMEDGWLYRNNNWYYLHTQYDNTRGHMYTGWRKWYYFNTASRQGNTSRNACEHHNTGWVDANGAWIGNDKKPSWFTGRRDPHSSHISSGTGNFPCTRISSNSYYHYQAMAAV